MKKKWKRVIKQPSFETQTPSSTFYALKYFEEPGIKSRWRFQFYKYGINQTNSSLDSL